MIDNKGKLFGRISVVDIIIVLAFIAAVAGFAYKLTAGSNTIVIKSDTPITMELKIEQARQYSVDAVVVGQNLYEEHADLIGTVTAVRTEPSYALGGNTDGTQTYAPVENRFDIYITVAATGRVSDGSYYLGGSRQVSRGSNIKLESQTMSCTAKVNSIS